jgi:hypothetical protein
MADDHHSTIDPDGRHIVLDERTIQHLRTRRPQMLGQIDAILQAVSRPDLIHDRAPEAKP